MMARRRRIESRVIAVALIFAAVFPYPARARAWDSATHRLIARLAVDSLPPSPLKAALANNEYALQEYAVAPDTVLKERYGKAEAIRHYINLEVFGSDPFNDLDPNFSRMERRYTARQLRKAGTLPWTIESVAAAVSTDWRNGDCARMLQDSGYLAHYVGDASQPLHSTIHFDGYRGDRGVHARIEGAVDHRTREIASEAAGMVHPSDISGVWPVEIAEIKRANALVGRLLSDDRAAREIAYRGPQYTRALFARDGTMFTSQVADAASVLASIWLYEWKQAGSPSRCASGN